VPFDTPHQHKPLRRKTLFLSDLHLGALGARPDLILSFLQQNPAQTYVLVGDVLDLWQPILPHWTAADQAVIDHLNRRADAGARLVYVTGNHDPHPHHAPKHTRLAADYCERFLHRAGNGARFLVLHGDQVDTRWVRSHLVTRLGSLIDHQLRRLDNTLRALRGATRNEARSAIEALLSTINALSYAHARHERSLIKMARDAGADGVICGHFHLAELHNNHGLIYANCGDWVDSFTALVEDTDGRFRLMGGRAMAGETPTVGVVRGLA